jgi:hypothetical protein
MNNDDQFTTYFRGERQRVRNAVISLLTDADHLLQKVVITNGPRKSMANAARPGAVVSHDINLLP